MPGKKEPPQRYSDTTLWEALAVLLTNPCHRQGAVKVVDAAIRSGLDDTNRLVAMKDEAIFERLRGAGFGVQPSDIVMFRHDFGHR